MTNHDPDCPFCAALDTAEKVGEHCALIQYAYNEDRPAPIQNLLDEKSVLCPTVILKEHSTKVGPAAATEAMSFLGKYKGLIKEVSVPGHWAFQVMPGGWAGRGKSALHEEK